MSPSSQRTGSSASYGSSPLISPMDLLTKGVIGHLPDLPDLPIPGCFWPASALAPLARRPRARTERRFLKPLCPVHLFDTLGLVGSVESKRSRQMVRRAVLRSQARARSAGRGASDARCRATFGDGGRS